VARSIGKPKGGETTDGPSFRKLGLCQHHLTAGAPFLRALCAEVGFHSRRHDKHFALRRSGAAANDPHTFTLFVIPNEVKDLQFWPVAHSNFFALFAKSE